MRVGSKDLPPRPLRGRRHTDSPAAPPDKPQRCRRRLCWAVACGVACGLGAALGSAAAAPPEVAGIVGADDRRLLAPTDQAAWNAVGRLNRSGRGYCTAVLIAPTAVLTAAHCLWDARRDQWLAADQLHFVAGYRRGSFAAHARGRSITTAAGLRLDALGMPTRPADDWAVIELDRDLARSAAIRPIPLAGGRPHAADSGGIALKRIGYSADRPHLPMIVDFCRVRGLAEQGALLIHDCDAIEGDSGSPLIIESASGPRVLAVHVALARYHQTILGVGVVLTRQVPASVLDGMTVPAP